MTFLIRLRIQHLRKNNKTGEEVDIAETIIEEEEMANIEEDEVETMKDVEAIEVQITITEVETTIIEVEITIKEVGVETSRARILIG